MSLGDIRDDFPMLTEWTHLNCGGMAPMPTEVGAELLRVPTAVVREGPLRLLTHDEEFLGIEAARAALARVLGADPDEIAFTTQFSTGVNIVVEGLPWRAGDEVIVTDQEHPALLTPLVNMAQRRDLKIRRLPVSHDPSEMLEGFRSLLTDRTRLVAVSHVTTDSGDRLPMEEIARLAHEQGSLVLVDGAHSVGQFPVDVHALGCDFYGIVGYKWLLGPYPSAALYIRQPLLDQLQVSWTGSRTTRTASVTMDIDELTWIGGARRFEYGGRPFSNDTAMAAGVVYVERLGITAIGDHARGLTAYLRAGLAGVPGARLHSPPEPYQATGIATISLATMDGVSLSAALRERWRIIQRPALWGTSVRISLAAFVEERDVDLLISALTALAKE